MASGIFDSCIEDMVSGAINFASDTFKCMLVGVSYTFNKKTHLKRGDVAGEINGDGYTSGGIDTLVAVTKDTTHDRIDISLGSAIWTGTITAAGAIYYKSRGGSETADELIAFIDF